MPQTRESSSSPKAGRLSLSKQRSRSAHRRSSSSQTTSQGFDTSRIIYPTLQKHPEPVDHPILVLCMSELDSVPESVGDDELFETVLDKLEPWAGEEGERGYVLIVLAAEVDGDKKGKDKARSRPGVGWWLWRWRRVPRHIRKNLKRLYLIQPTPFARSALPLLLPLLSPKAYAKLFQLPTLLELYHNHGVSLKGVDLPLAVITEEARVRPKESAANATWGSSIAYALGTMGSYLSFPGLTATTSITASSGPARGYWDRDIDELVRECGGKVPPIFDELRQIILEECVATEGIFRLTPNSHLRSVVVELLNLPLDSQPSMLWRDIARTDPLLPPKLMSRLLSRTSGPLIRPDQYDLVRQATTAEATRTILLPALSQATRLVLTHVVSTLHAVSRHASQTRMTPLNLAICIAPDLIKGPDPMEDAGLCMEPGRTLPAQMRMRAGKEGQGDGTLVGLLELWIREFDQVSTSIESFDGYQSERGRA